jgi:hypothetical protein
MGIHLQLDERLSILRDEDHFRRWDSLGDKRLCIVCEKTFTGRQIEIRRNRNGGHELRCPTAGCNSQPPQWVYPLNSEPVYQDWWRPLTAATHRQSVKTVSLAKGSRL